MFGFKYAKFAPGYYVIRYKKGKMVEQGDGLSFNFYSPNTSIVAVKTASSDAHFMFSEVTVDFQEITIQGLLIYRVTDPAKTAQMLNHTVNNTNFAYITDDPQKLPERLINLALVSVKTAIKSIPLKEVITSADMVENAIFNSLNNHDMVKALGVEVLSVTVAAIKPNVETARALEAQTREQILKESDDAVFLRRNSAVEQERIIRENELNTEIAVENKNHELREKQMESHILMQQKEQEMEEMQQDFNIKQEERNKELIELKTQNEKKEADARAYSVSAILKSYEGVSPEVLNMLANSNMDSGRLMALAFQGIADRAEKIGQLNISPELLRTIMEKSED